MMGTRRALLLTRPDYARRWGLRHAWRFNGDGGDSYGNRPLSAVNTPTFAAAKAGLGTSLVAASNQHWSVASAPSLSPGTASFWVGAWVQLSAVGSQAIAGKFAATGNQREYILVQDTSLFRFYASADGTAGAAGVYDAVGATDPGLPSTGVWYFVLGWYDSVASTINIRVNHGTPTSLAHNNGAFAGTANFMVGRFEATYAFGGVIDQVLYGVAPPGGIAGRINEISRVLYASGNGREGRLW